MNTVFGFPDFVNEKAARVVAVGVAMMAAVVVLADQQWLLPVMALGFLLRVLAGPKLSPLGLLASRVIAPRLGEPKVVAGAPKRFAQGVGLVVTTLATLLGPVLGYTGAAAGLATILLLFATLEGALGFCAGCWAYGLLIRAGVFPEEACEACSDISLRRRQMASVDA